MSPRMPSVGDPNQPPPTQINKEAARRLLGWLWPYRWTIAFNILFTLALTAITLAVPRLLKYVIDSVVATFSEVKAATEAGELARAESIKADAWHGVAWVLAGFAAIFLASEVFRHFEIRRVMSFSQRFMAKMRQRFFHHLHELSLRYYDKMKAGQLIARGTTDIDTLEGTVSWAPNHLVYALVMVVSVVVIMAVMDWVLFLVVFPILPILYLLTGWFQRRATVAWREVRRQTGRLTANVAESIAGARVIQAFAREQRNEAAFSDLTTELYDVRIETERVRARYLSGMRVLQRIGPVAVILVGAWRITVDPEVTAGTVVAFLGYVYMFFMPMEMLSELYNQFLHALAAAERIIEVLDARPDIVDKADARRPEDFEGEVAFDDVTFEYVPGAPVLKEIRCTVRPGEVVALVGPTGAGKTTFCRLIARFYEAQQGAVRIDGTDVRDIAQDVLHQRTGIVLQENFLFAGTVMDNIRYGRPAATDEEIVETAGAIGSHRAIEALPQGYETEVGERGSTLSAGQRQLICFTRAMLADPRILILDEATSSVDTQTELEIQEALRRLTQQRTCFIVAHRLSTVRRADRVFVIEGGRITETGTHQELLASDGRYAEMYMEFIRSE